MMSFCCRWSRLDEILPHESLHFGWQEAVNRFSVDKDISKKKKKNVFVLKNRWKWHQTQHNTKLLPTDAPPTWNIWLPHEKKKKEKQVKPMDTSNTKTTRGDERLQAVIINHHHEEVQLQDRSGSFTQEGDFIVQNNKKKLSSVFQCD